MTDDSEQSLLLRSRDEYDVQEGGGGGSVDYASATMKTILLKRCVLCQ